MKLAIFDFDHTISNKDSYIDFIFYSNGFLKTIVGFLCLSPVLFLYLLKIIPNYQTKQIVLCFFYKGWRESEFRWLAGKYSKERLPKIIKESALNKIQWHKDKGHAVVVVTASLEYYLSGWCEAQKVNLLGTKISFEEEKVTGLLDGPNCWGLEKIKRLKECYDLSQYSYIYAYGDSRGDMYFKEIADVYEHKLF